MEIIAKGEKNRSVSATDKNERSSRAHTIFQLTIESRTIQKHENEEVIVLQSQLNLIDLAGSEKVNKDIDRQKEGSFINRSLLTLGNVIEKITQDKFNGYIPFRDSKLTRLLQSSLQGNARLAIICTISPSFKNMDESLNTLKFAQRAKRITPRPEAKPILDNKTLLKRYKMEVEELRIKLQETNIELEKQRMKDNDITVDERDAYEAKLEDARLVF